ncbi:unnamed protein product [Nezara viridula]|uniref:TLC domain-containing protein n=1 Tax=Nezara viridula TaxID=85310 RepID=A0A9P0ML40_NEZVI|nr:unnamed protein product [Nezara viridula]
METLCNAVEPYRQSLAYAPIGILLCSIPWFALTKITEKISFVDAEHLRKTFLALLYTGAYVYMWTKGSNPHDVEVKENVFADELFLLLGGGYYLIHTQRPTFRHIAHGFLFVVLIIAVIIHAKLGAAANLYGFLVEAPNVFLMLTAFFEKLHFMAITWALKYLSIIVYFMSNIDVCNVGCRVMTNEEIPVHIRVVFLFLLILQFLNIIEEVSGLMGGKESGKPEKPPQKIICTHIKCSTTSLCCS